MKKYRVTKEHPFLKEGLELEEGIFDLKSIGSNYCEYKNNLENHPTWFEEIDEPVELPKEECQEEHCCMCHECENTRPMTPGEAEIAKGLDEAFPEPKEKSLYEINFPTTPTPDNEPLELRPSYEKSLSEIIKILEDLKCDMEGKKYVSETSSHRESFNLGIEMCLVKLEKVILKLKNL